MSRTVIFCRHAKPVGHYELSDLTPPLSSEGREKQREVALFLKEKGYQPDAIFTSPLLRAQQSGEVMGEIFSIQIETEEALGIDFDAEGVKALLNRQPAGSTTVLVGHEPTLALLVNALCGKTYLPAGLSKSGTAVAQFEGEIEFGKGKFVAYYHPDQI